MARTYIPTFVREAHNLTIYAAAHGADLNVNIGLVSLPAQTAYGALVTALNNFNQYESVLLPVQSGEPEQFIT